MTSSVVSLREVERRGKVNSWGLIGSWMLLERVGRVAMVIVRLD